jgi:hypothetical protein
MEIVMTTTNNPLNPSVQNADSAMKRLLNSLFAIKVLLAFYTVPHNATALGIIHPSRAIEYTFDTFLRVLGLLVFEGAFLAMGYLISKGLIKGERQGTFAWVVYGMTITFMASNSILATSLQRAFEYGYEIAPFLATYQAYIAPITAILIASSLSAIGFYHPPFEISRIKATHATHDQRIKLQLALDHATAEAEQEKITLRLKIEEANTKAAQQILKNDAQLEAMNADNEMELVKLRSATTVKKKIAEETTQMMTNYIDGTVFKKSVRATTIKNVQAMIDEYNGVEPEVEPEAEPEAKPEATPSNLPAGN